jgi:hypothetical protein
MTKMMPKQEPQSYGLVGRCFHVFAEDGTIERQGIVRADLGGGGYLVQYFEWFAGTPSTMEVRYITEMKPGRGNGSWQFYEDNEHMSSWYETYGKNREPKEAA